MASCYRCDSDKGVDPVKLKLVDAGFEYVDLCGPCVRKARDDPDVAAIYAAPGGG